MHTLCDGGLTSLCIKLHRDDLVVWSEGRQIFEAGCGVGGAGGRSASQAAGSRRHPPANAGTPPPTRGMASGSSGHSRLAGLVASDDGYRPLFTNKGTVERPSPFQFHVPVQARQDCSAGGGFHFAVYVID
jgi:hypothetical protein